MQSFNEIILEALIDKRLSYLKKPFLLLSSLLSRQSKGFLKRNIYKTTSLEYKNILIKYFKDYDISYDNKIVKKRIKEDSSLVLARQKKYIDNKKSKGYKKIQVYISDNDYKMLLEMKHNKNKTFAEIIGASINCKYRTWRKKIIY